MPQHQVQPWGLLSMCADMRAVHSDHGVHGLQASTQHMVMVQCMTADDPKDAALTDEPMPYQTPYHRSLTLCVFCLDTLASFRRTPRGLTAWQRARLEHKGIMLPC